MSLPVGGPSSINNRPVTDVAPAEASSEYHGHTYSFQGVPPHLLSDIEIVKKALQNNGKTKSG